jgi:DNA-binding XRE family transcriptional regulator
MTKRIRGANNSSRFTIGSAFPPTVDTGSIPPAPETKRADILQWESCFRAQDVPLPDGFEDIDTAVASLEREPARRAGLENARRRIAEKFPEKLSGLAALRMRHGWSQKQLAEAIGTSQPHIARIENGRDNVLLATANQLARALQVSLEQINAALGFGEEKS